MAMSLSAFSLAREPKWHLRKIRGEYLAGRLMCQFSSFAFGFMAKSLIIGKINMFYSMIGCSSRILCLS